MNEELKTVAVPIDADLLKRVKASISETNTTAEGQVTVTLQATPEQLQKLTELRQDIESYERSQVAEWHTTTDRFIKTSELRISFYERLILVASGSFALSLTFMGSLQRHASQSPALTPLLATGRLKAAWILLLMCIVFSWLHNLYRYVTMDSLSALTATNVAVKQHTWEHNLVKRAAGLFKGMEASTSLFSDLFLLLAQYSSHLSAKQNESLPGYAKDLKKIFTCLGYIRWPCASVDCPCFLVDARIRHEERNIVIESKTAQPDSEEQPGRICLASVSGNAALLGSTHIFSYSDATRGQPRHQSTSAQR